MAFVQTPQYYANGESGPIAAAAAAQQNLFFGPIVKGKDGPDSIFCCDERGSFRCSRPSRRLEGFWSYPLDDE